VYQRYVKRLLDIALSAAALLFLAPIMALIAIWIKIDSPGPVYFVQRRVGLNKTCFSMLKYRTMKIDAPHDSPTHQLDSSDQWITTAGKTLRKLSLDELPQLYNILLSDMSIIGPRPALWNQKDLIDERDTYCANDVLPGLTGWAQVNGRDELSIDRKATFDGEYVKRMSFALDTKCFLFTLAKVIKHDGVVEGATQSIDSCGSLIT